MRLSLSCNWISPASSGSLLISIMPNVLVIRLVWPIFLLIFMKCWHVLSGRYLIMSQRNWVISCSISSASVIKKALQTVLAGAFNRSPQRSKSTHETFHLSICCKKVLMLWMLTRSMNEWEVIEEVIVICLFITTLLKKWKNSGGFKVKPKFIFVITTRWKMKIVGILPKRGGFSPRGVG